MTSHEIHGYIGYIIHDKQYIYKHLFTIVLYLLTYIVHIQLQGHINDTLAILKYAVQQGWPTSIKHLPSKIQSFWTFREELTIEDGLILKGTRIVIQSKKQDTILKPIHKGYLGLTKCKLHAKETVYWPGLNEQLEKLILNYPLHLKYSQSKFKQPVHMSLGQEIPIHPWTILSTDISHFEGESYLLLVDYTSCFPVVCRLNSMTAQHVINHFKLIFS